MTKCKVAFRGESHKRRIFGNEVLLFALTSWLITIHNTVLGIQSSLLTSTGTREAHGAHKYTQEDCSYTYKWNKSKTIEKWIKRRYWSVHCYKCIKTVKAMLMAETEGWGAPRDSGRFLEVFYTYKSISQWRPYFNLYWKAASLCTRAGETHNNKKYSEPWRGRPRGETEEVWKIRRNAGNEQKRRWEALKGQLNTASATLFLSGTQSSLPKGKLQKNQAVLSSGQTHTPYKYQTQL